MKILSWVVLGAIGFGIMCFGYSERERASPGAPWAEGLILIGPPPAAGEALPGGATPVLLRLLPGSERAQEFLKGIDMALPKKAAQLRAQLQHKLIAVPLKALAIDESSLESGRLPSEEGGEVLAGPGSEYRPSIPSGNRTYAVVGRLKRDYGLFERSYLVPARDAEAASMPRDDRDVREATLLQLSDRQVRDPKVREQLEHAFPAAKYERIAPADRLDSRAFYLYISGLAIMLLGGSGALISLYQGLAFRAQGSKPPDSPELAANTPEALERKPWPSWLAAPLIELDRRPRLVWALHIGYFGLVIVGAIVVHLLPELQTILLSQVSDALNAKGGPLGAAGQAYGSRNILRAATVTFGVNFFLGSLLMITLPSMIVPGCGILLAILRSFAWGLLLAPTMGMLALTMIPHSGTLLLEGEGYILATIFAVLIPIRTFDSRLGEGPAMRFARAILLNVQASVWVAIVLAVAAIYEATEVIAMMG
jgi:hypothetical protein